ncbi:MAG: TIGR01777 family oxidoreductase [Bacteroidota bacterium]
MKYLITGGTGLVGSHLIPQLLQEGHEVHNLSRRSRSSKHAGLTHHQWDGKSVPTAVGPVDAIVNLAGATIGKRWSESYKKLIYDSRVDATTACVNYIQAQQTPPQVFISASGYNYYGNIFTETLDESAPAGEGFMAEVCVDWEAAAQGTGVRTVNLRTSVVLDAKEGPLAKLLTPFRLFVGGPTGTGKQGWPWIHVEDMVRAIRFLADTEGISGPINMVVPRHGNMDDFATTLGKALGRPSFFRLPKGVLEIIFGEMSVVLWGGGFIVPKALQDHGFEWKFPELKPAFTDLLQR